MIPVRDGRGVFRNKGEATMTKQEKEDLVKGIWFTFEQGGGFAHNIIPIDLTRLSKHDKQLADNVYQELLDEGF